ncbi:MAG: complex I NDUFA9 subunit family protein [Nitrospinota bacterium]|nr:complex I NDUFA9 subunit family protein [Nitrospinota bacterium]
MKVFIAGGSGYIGRVLVRQLSLAGHECRVMCRNPELERQRLVGEKNIYPVRGDIVDYSTNQLAQLIGKSDALINLVGIITEKGTAGFEKIHTEGTRRLSLASEQAGVNRFVQMSALGTRESAVSKYHQTKWEAESFVRTMDFNWTIFRPSIVFGQEDEFLNVFAGMARLLPVLPLIGGGHSKLQPIWVEDVCHCFVKSLDMPETFGKTYDQGGNHVFSLKELIELVVKSIGKKRFLAPLPFPIATAQAKFFKLLPIKPPFTEDQITMLKEDNVCDSSEMKEVFNIQPLSMIAYLEKKFGTKI